MSNKLLATTSEEFALTEAVVGRLTKASLGAGKVRGEVKKGRPDLNFSPHQEFQSPQ